MSENKYYGLYQGIVTNISDPEKRGRIKVKCPSVLGADTESAWCDPLVQVAYDNGGDFCLPTKDEAVWLQFIEGDANKPVWMGGWWQKDKTPLGGNYSGIDKLRIINYADCTITMQNGKIDINIADGSCDLRIEHNKVTVKGNLLVEGSVTASDVRVVAGQFGGGTVVADSEVTAQTVKLTTHKHKDIMVGADESGEPVK